MSELRVRAQQQHQDQLLVFPQQPRYLQLLPVRTSSSSPLDSNSWLQAQRTAPLPPPARRPPDPPDFSLPTVRYEDTLAGQAPVLVSTIKGSPFLSNDLPHLKDRRPQISSSPTASSVAKRRPLYLSSPSQLNINGHKLPMASGLMAQTAKGDTDHHPDKRRQTVRLVKKSAGPTINGAIPVIAVNDEIQQPPDSCDVANTRVSGNGATLSTNGNGLLQLTTTIPSSDLPDFANEEDVSFSKRGSVLMGGQRACPAIPSPTDQHFADKDEVPHPRSTSLAPSPSDRRPQTAKNENGRGISAPPSSTRNFTLANSRLLTADEELQSNRVRSMYEHGDPIYADLDELRKLGEGGSHCGPCDAPTPTPGARTDPISDTTPDSRNGNVDQRGSLDELGRGARSSRGGWAAAGRSSFDKRRLSLVIREENELAGGFEDWQNLEGASVDRYGFIVPKLDDSKAARSSSVNRSPSFAGHQRVATALQLASEQPRKTGTIRRSKSIKRDTLPARRSLSATRSPSTARPLKGSASLVDLNTRERAIPESPTVPTPLRTPPSSYHSPKQPLRHRLPGANRRLVRDASDMLTLPSGPPGADPHSSGQSVTFAESPYHKARETERQEKWRKMAYSTPSARGSGMTFFFPTQDPKLVERTWKGIPDRWRSAAWSSFLATSAAKNPAARSDDALIDAFHGLQETPCRDDGQIDLDVPRTISMHIMFRRRYRGGQRSLFRVLHALALFKPQPGYVQGMASIVATLLCYFEEEMAFVMAVRMWEERGLADLYGEGFAGLSKALNALDRQWLGRKEVWSRIDKELGVGSMAFGAKWYLTLFNYCIPFSAQLRVWDVFMLLGESRGRSSRRPMRPDTQASLLSPDSNSLTPGKKRWGKASSNGSHSVSASPAPSSRFGRSRSRDVSTKGERHRSAAVKSPILPAGLPSHETLPSVDEDSGSNAAMIAVTPVEDVEFGPQLDVLHAVATALIDGMSNVLENSDFECCMKAVTSWIPIRDEDMLMMVARAEYKRCGGGTNRKKGH